MRSLKVSNIQILAASNQQPKKNLTRIVYYFHSTRKKNYFHSLQFNNFDKCLLNINFTTLTLCFETTFRPYSVIRFTAFCNDFFFFFCFKYTRLAYTLELLLLILQSRFRKFPWKYDGTFLCSHEANSMLQLK